MLSVPTYTIKHGKNWETVYPDLGLGCCLARSWWHRRRRGDSPAVGGDTTTE
jgi:hypothetical protein